MVTGATVGVMVCVWKFCLRQLGGVLDIYELLPAFLLACVVLVVASLVTAPPSKELTDEFEAVKRVKSV